MASNPDIKPIYIGKTLHRKFKVFCVNKGSSMADEMERIIEQELKVK